VIGATTMTVVRWTKDQRPFEAGRPTLWSCSLDLRTEHGSGRVVIGLDLPYREVQRLDALIARGHVQLSEIFGAEPITTTP
jgi:hypothetical protein